jgi:4-hydroxy-tetrahydrodipicolinate synthase
MYRPGGIISSMVTCFDSRGELDLKAHAQNIKFQRAAGIKTICVLGGTGEAASLTADERRGVMDETMRSADEMQVVFGAMAGRPDEIAEDIKLAKKLGAAACMVMPPPFVVPSGDDVKRLVRQYALLGMPIIVFNTPKRSSFLMSADLIAELSSIDGVVGIKESSQDLVLLQNIYTLCRRDFALLTGGDNLYLPSVVLGATGGILASAAVIPEVCLALDKAIADSRMDEARTLHYAVKLLDDVLYKASHPVPLKLAMHSRGLASQICRPPFADIGGAHRKAVYDALKEIKTRVSGLVKFVEEYPI